MKIVSSGRGIHSTEFFKRKQKRKKFFRLGLVLIFFILLGSIIFALRAERFLIKEVIMPQDGVVGEAEAINITRQILSENYLWIIPKSNFLIYPEDMIEEILMRKITRFKEVDAGLADFKTLKIEVEEREPTAIYFKDSNEQYFLDEEGLIFSLATASTEEFLSFKTTTKIGEPLGKTILPAEEFKTLNKFIEELIESGIQATSVEIDTNEYSLVHPSGAKIIWMKNANFELIHTNLLAFLNDPKISGDKSFLDKVLYLDLRVDNKIFYKLRP